jgi:hypothetical protein
MGNPAIFLTTKTYGSSYWIGMRFGSNLLGDYVALDMSNNGMYQYLATNNGTFVYLNMTKYVSNNEFAWFGYTITAPVPHPAKWSAVTCSGDGSRVYAAVSSSLTVGGPLVFYSTNYLLFKNSYFGTSIGWTAAANSGSLCIIKCV